MPPKADAARRAARAARKGDDEYLMAALERGDTAFLGYFERTHPELHRRYETLCRDNGKLEEFRANPLVFILANQPECCTHVAKRFIDGPDAAPAKSAAPPSAQAAGAARSHSRSPHGIATATAQTARRGSRATLPMFDGHDPRWKKGKVLMKSLYDMPRARAMSDAEFLACQSFIDDTLMVSDWPRDNFQRHGDFLQMVRKSYAGSTELGLNVPWHVLKAKYDRDNHDAESRDPPFRLRPGFREMDDKCYVACFEIGPISQTARKTEWAEFTHDYVRSIAQEASPPPTSST